MDLIEAIAKDLIIRNGCCDVLDVYNATLAFKSVDYEPRDVFVTMQSIKGISSVKGIYTFAPRNVKVTVLEMCKQLHKLIGKVVEIHANKIVEGRISTVNELGIVYIEGNSVDVREINKLIIGNLCMQS